jgi:hypothetical protein
MFVKALISKVEHNMLNYLFSMIVNHYKIMVCMDYKLCFLGSMVSLSPS